MSGTSLAEKNRLQIFEALFSKIIGEGPGFRDRTRQNIPSWDSLKHAALVIEMEKKLQRRFSVSEIEKMNSYTEILKILEL